MSRQRKALKKGRNCIFIWVQTQLTQMQSFDEIRIMLSFAILLATTVTERPHRKSVMQHDSPVVTFVLQGSQ